MARGRCSIVKNAKALISKMRTECIDPRIENITLEAQPKKRRRRNRNQPNPTTTLPLLNPVSRTAREDHQSPIVVAVARVAADFVVLGDFVRQQELQHPILKASSEAQVTWAWPLQIQDFLSS